MCMGKRIEGECECLQTLSKKRKKSFFTEGYEGSLQNIRVTKFAEPSNDPNLVALRTILFAF